MELNTQDLDEILGYSSCETPRPHIQHAEEKKEPEMEPELAELSLPPVHPPSIPASMQLTSINPSPTYDYLAAAASLSPPLAASPPVRSPSPKRARSSAASGVRASGLRRKPLAQLLIQQRQAAALPLHHPPPLGAIPNVPLSVELTAIILSKLDEWRKGESAASVAAYAAAGTTATSKQERMAAARVAGCHYVSARRIEVKLLMGPKCATRDCSSTIAPDRSNVRWFHCDHLDPSTKLNPDDILCNCQSITSLQRFLLKNTYNGRLYFQLLCLNCHALKPQ